MEMWIAYAWIKLGMMVENHCVVPACISARLVSMMEDFLAVCVILLKTEF